MRKILVALIHPEEWNQYIPFNGYLSNIKKEYDYVIGVVAQNAISLISEADEYYSVKNGDSDFTYPHVLDTSKRESNLFINTCVEKIKEDFKDDDLHFVSWQKTNYHHGIVDIKGPPGDVYLKSFKYAQDWYKTNKLIYPTKKTFDEISEKYKHLFKGNDYIVLTREFKKKATPHNTKISIPNFKEFITSLINSGINVINIGFPPSNLGIDHENYTELFNDITQNELISLFYLSKGILTQADSGGFVSHYSANSDFFTLTNQWSMPNSDFKLFDIVSNKTKKVLTTDLTNYIKSSNFKVIAEMLNNHKPSFELKFESDKKITFVK